jgi:methyl-accepting chemotaxis protein
MGAPKRRILFIEKAFQIRFMLKVIGVIVLGTALTGGFLYLFGNYQISRMYTSAHYDLKESWEVFSQAVLVASFLSMTLVAVLAVFFTLYDSHKIGGPLYRFRQNLHDIGGGNLTLHTKLRDGDELRPFVDTMNEMTLSLRAKVVAIRDGHAELLQALAQAEAKAAEKGDAASLAAVRRAADAMGEKFGALKVDP